MKGVLVLSGIIMMMLMSVSALAWVGDWGYRMPIDCTNVTTGTPIVVGGTSGISVNGSTEIIWTQCRPSLFLYFNSSSSYQIGDNGTSYPFEVSEGLGTSESPESVWSNYWEVWHMNENGGGKLLDSVDSTRGLVELGTHTTTSESGFIGQARGFSETDSNNKFFCLEANKTTSMGKQDDWTVIYFVQSNYSGNDYMQTLSLGNMIESYPSMMWVAYHHSVDWGHFTSLEDTPSSLVFDTNPHIFFYTKEGGNISLYSNDSSTSVTRYFTKTPTDNNFTYSNTSIGCNPDQNWGWRGLIDEVLIVKENYTSTDMENVLNNYQATSGYGDVGIVEELNPPIPPPTDPTNLLNTGGDWGMFPFIYDKELMWDASTSNRTNISYECRMVSYGVIGCDNFQPPDDVVYDFEYTNDDGASWHIADSGAYDYQLYGGFPDWEETGWATYTTLLFKTADFPTGDMRMRIRAFDGYLYSNWVESDNFTNYPSNWSCIAYDNQSCIEGYYACTMATDLNLARPDTEWFWNFGEFTTYLNNKTACACVPDWNCTTFTSCVANNKNCTDVEDLNLCGELFTGNLSDYDESCTIPPPITGYVSQFGVGDLPKMFVDILGGALYILIGMASLVVVAVVVVLGVKGFKKIRGGR